jgi:hypothetical protein
MMPDESGLFTAKGRLLLEIVNMPGTTIKKLAETSFLTKRSIWGYIGRLRGMKYIIAIKKGRTHHYYVTDLALDELRKLTEGKSKW